MRSQAVEEQQEEMARLDDLKHHAEVEAAGYLEDVEAKDKRIKELEKEAAAKDARIAELEEQLQKMEKKKEKKKEKKRRTASD